VSDRMLDNGHHPTSADVRARLDHPVIDADGHMIEFEPDVVDVFVEVAGRDVADRYLKGVTASRWYRWHELTDEQRRDRRALRPPWWGIPAQNTLDRATATIPGLLAERLGEFGIDFAFAFPSLGATAMRPNDAEIRQAACRAFNTYYSRLYGPHSERMTPVGVIPMHDPQEAVEELDYAVRTLGLKAVTMPSYVRRTIPIVEREAPQAAPWAYWLDTYGLDSDHDYDPVWAKCVELGVAPAFHSTSVWSGHASISNYAHNHIGTFATAAQATCKSLFFGGVTRRFPSLRFAFLEGGAAWGCTLYAALVEHWKKRNIETIERYNPANLDRELLLDLYRRYGGPMADKLDRLGSGELVAAAGLGVVDDPGEDAGHRDEWAPCEIERAEDVRDLFVDSFYFGCEADDRSTAWAVDTAVNPFGARLKTLFGSDIGHWDVSDMAGVVAEAWELVGDGIIGESDFRDFVFTNPVSFYAGGNPSFFDGTVIESKARAALT
jgi:predicted TIM-barrel fold metal-dependent hydrolase